MALRISPRRNVGEDIPDTGSDEICPILKGLSEKPYLPYRSYLGFNGSKRNKADREHRLEVDALKRSLIVMIILTMLAIPSIPLHDQEASVPAHIMTAGDTNAFIGPGAPRDGSPASDPANWYLGHVPVAGENVLFDARAGYCEWDIDVTVNDFTVLANFTGGGRPIITVYNSQLRIGGNLTLFSGTLKFSGYMNDNNFVSGWTDISGNNTAIDARFVNANYGNAFYFNGPFSVEWRNIGFIGFEASYVVFNSTFNVNGTTMPRDFVIYNSEVDWGSLTYVDFKGDARINGTHALILSAGHAHEDFTCVNVSDYLLLYNPDPNLGFTFSKRPVFENISKCSTCGYPINLNIEYSGAIGLNDAKGSSRYLFGYWYNFTGFNSTIFDGYVSDFISNLTIGSHGTIYQTSGLQIGSASLADPSIMNIVNGSYQINGSQFLFISPAFGTALGDDHIGTLNVYSTFSLGSGVLTTDRVNLKGGTFYGQSGTIQVNNFDSSNGTFMAGNSNLLLSHTINYSFASAYYYSPTPYLPFENDNPPGTLKTDGTRAGGFYDLCIEKDANVTLLSDVYVNHRYVNLGGTIQLNGFHLYFDEIAPTTTDALTGTLGESGWFRSNVSVSLSADDAMSGVNATFYRIGTSGSWSTYSIPFLLSGEGNFTVQYYSMDNSGNNESVNEIIVKIEKTRPTLTINQTSFFEVTVNCTTISWNGSDATSGIDHFEVSIDGGAFSSVGTVMSYNFSGLADGVHNVTVKAIDIAGNEVYRTIRFIVRTSGSGGGISGDLILFSVNLAIIILVIAAAVAIMKRMKRSPPTESDEMEAEPPAPPGL